MNDILINKVQSIQRCASRAREEYNADPAGFTTNFTRQDAALLNIVRACETAIDLANHAIRVLKLGIPTTSSESFRLLEAAKVIDSALSDRLQRMVGFRNTVVHQYTATNLQIVEAVLAHGLDDLLAFAEVVRLHLKSAAPE